MARQQSEQFKEQKPPNTSSTFRRGFGRFPSGSFLAFHVPKCKHTWCVVSNKRRHIPLNMMRPSPHRAKRSVLASFIGLWDHSTTENAVDKPAYSTGCCAQPRAWPDKSINGGWPRPASRTCMRAPDLPSPQFSMNVTLGFPCWVTLRGGKVRGRRRAVKLED